MTSWLAAHIDYVNEALAAIGAAGNVQSIDEDTKLARKAVAAYWRAHDDVLARYPWHWSLKTASLQVAAVTDKRGWSYAFDLPAVPNERIGPVKKFLADPRLPSRPERDYELQEGRVFCDRAALWAVYQTRVDPAEWPAYFRSLVVAAAAAEMCIPITADRNFAGDLRAKAFGPEHRNGLGGKMGEATLIDAQSGGASAPLTAADPLTLARGAGVDGAWWG